MSDNFKRFKGSGSSRKSVDGFMRAPRTPNSQIRLGVNGQQNEPRVLLGSFAQKEGFTPSGTVLQNSVARQTGSIGGGTTSPQSTPEVLPPIDQNIFDIPKSKKHRRHLLKLRRPRLKTVFKSLAVSVLIVVLIFGGIIGKGWLKARQIFKGGSNGAVALTRNVDPSLLKTEGDGRVNIMMLAKGGPGHEGGDLTDTMLIASIDPQQKEAALLSIPRDLYIKYPGVGSMKINAVYSTAKQQSLASRKNSTSQKEAEAQAETAGLKKIESVLETTIGIPINYYVMVDFTAFKEAVDTVNGVDITLDEAVYDPNFDWQYGRNALKLPKGLNHLDGLHALLLGRSRGAAGGYGVASDFDRNENQRKILINLKEKIISLGTLGNPLKISALIDNFGDHIQTNFTTGELMKLYDIAKEIDSSKVASIGLTDPPHALLTTEYLDGQSIVLPKAGLYNFKEIQSFVRNTLKDGYLKNENARIVVLNGSGIAGRAAARGEDLKSYGYTVTKVGDAPVAQTKTRIIDLTNGTMKYTKRYLELRLQNSAETTLPEGFSPENADFVIILGANEATTP